MLKNSFLIVVVMVLVGCNPVRFVLRDAPSFRIVADEVIKRGYCLNDTTYILSTDTLEITDTLTMVYVDTAVVNDTTYLWETKFKTITKTRTIRDSIKSVVIDSAQVKVLRRHLQDSEIKLKDALSDQKILKRIMFFMGGGALIFFLLLFKLK
jgi:hypothetical protein